jgi:hypothetical protein
MTSRLGSWAQPGWRSARPQAPVSGSRASTTTGGRLSRLISRINESTTATSSPGSTPRTSTPTSAISESTNALLRMRPNRSSSRTLKKPEIATTTMAARVASGSCLKSEVRNAPVSRTIPAATSEESCVLPPARSPAIVWLAPPDCTNPLENPASRFEPPRATRSRFTSTRYPSVLASARETPAASALRISIPAAAGSKSTRSFQPTSGTAGSGRAEGSLPKTATPCESRSRIAETTIEPTSRTSIAGTRGATRPRSGRRRLSVPRQASTSSCRPGHG